jgi:hypothetical protein
VTSPETSPTKPPSLTGAVGATPDDRDEARERTVRPLAILLAANLVASVVFAGLTLLFSHAVVDYQLARHPGLGATGQQEIGRQLLRTLWIRAALVLVFSGYYLRLARRLRRGNHGAYLRIRLASLFGLAGVGYLLFAGEYPLWLRAIQVAQLVALMMLVVAANRRTTRDAFPRNPTAVAPAGNRKAAWTLLVLTPLIAEFTFATTPIAMAWLVVLYVPIYGAGVLVIRELIRRSGGRWASILLMGLAYGLVEEGIALQSLTSPRLYGAARWAPRVLGFNTAYAELNLVYHAVFSVALPIALVELLFRHQGRRPYLSRGGVFATGIVALAGVGLLRVTIPPTADPGYLAPPAALMTFAGVVGALAVIALRGLPGRARHTNARPNTASRTAHPRVVGVFCGGCAIAFFGLLDPFGGATQPAFTHGTWVLLPMLAAAVLAVSAGLLLRRWSTATHWTNRHRLAAITGALVAHTVFGITAKTHTIADALSYSIVAIVMVFLLALLGRRVRHGAP